MGKVAYIYDRDLDRYSDLNRVSRLDSVEDVATLVEVFEYTIRSISYRDIRYVVRDSEGYLFLVVGSGGSSFDLFEFIGSAFSGGSRVSACNVRYLFPRSLSRGIFDGDVDIDDYDDVATSFLDEGDLDLPVGREYKVYYAKMGVSISISGGSGVMFGRSAKKVDFLIRGNSNVGRVHCNLYINGAGELMVHDFDSLNGTFVNGVKVSSSKDVRLVEGDIIVMADEEFKVL